MWIKNHFCLEETNSRLKKILRGAVGICVNNMLHSLRFFLKKWKETQMLGWEVLSFFIIIDKAWKVFLLDQMSDDAIMI